MICRKSDEQSCNIAADYIRRGKVVILPTDTVYGFSGIVDGRHYSYHTDADIRAIKGRAETKPLIQLISKPECLKNYTQDIVPAKLLEKWPGALTIIVHTCTKDDQPSTTAFRCPGDEWIRHVIELCGAPIYSTSVNRSGQPVLDTISAIKAEFEKDVALIVDDGDKKGALPSTIVSISENGEVTVVRQGSVIID